ncbi:hypothetical protein [Streptomyces sp. NPDC012616]|uniref:hypothetical protein n=1 Tax=Streptomyces sp. NPDC012616 TaxID=3364840 RepID=UPI0036E23E15
MHGHVRTVIGERVIVRFDARHSLSPADSRQPSLVTEVVAVGAVALDRRLVPVRQFADRVRAGRRLTGRT